MVILNNTPETQVFKIMKTNQKSVDGNISKYYTKAEADQRFQPIGDYITENDLKTINGESLIGTGDIVITVDTYTKAEIDEKFENVDLTGYATETWVNEQGFLKEIPSDYVTESELDGKGYLTSIPDDYVTESELSNKGYLTSVPDNYATKAYVDEAIGIINNQLELI